MLGIIKLGSCFTGIGAWEKALDRLGVNYELQWFFEIDKYAIKSYCAVHNETPEKNMGNIVDVDETQLADVDMIVYSPPCQSFSIAGNGGGTSDPRGILFYDALRIIKDKQPKCAVMENVKNLTGKKFKNEYIKMLNDLEQAGYNNYSKVLNSKNYGVPQSRERVFIISIRKDVDPYQNNLEGYPFPEPFDNGLRLKDFLEDEVDEKFYISEEKTEKLTNSLFAQERDRIQGREGICNTLLARDYKDPKCVNEPKIIDDQGRTKKKLTAKTECPTLRAQDHGNPPKVIEDFYQSRPPRTFDECPTIRSERTGLMVTEPNECNCIGRVDIKGHDQVKRVYSPDGCSPTISTCGGGHREPKTVVPCLTPDRVKKRQNGRRFKEDGEPMFSLTTQDRHGVMESGFRIRKLTPKECWRLMGFTDTDFDKAAYTQETVDILGGKKCTVKLKIAKENQSQSDMETYVLCTTKDTINTEIQQLINKKIKAEKESQEKMQNVNIAIEILEELGQGECATSITKCTDFTETLYTSMKGKGQQAMVIIELEEKEGQNIGKYMKITLGENLTQKKLFTILTLIEQIIKSKIYTCILQKANIHGNIAITEESKSDLKIMKLSNLKMEYTTRLTSNSALYKQAGNSIVVDTLYYLLKPLFDKMQF